MIRTLLLFILIGVVFIGCKETDGLTDFSKRKYLKRTTHQKPLFEETQQPNQVLASSEINIAEIVHDKPKITTTLHTDTLISADTIITKKGKIIICTITLINDQNIFYNYKKRKKVYSDYISLDEVNHYSSSNASVHQAEIQKEDSTKTKVNRLSKVDTIFTYIGTNIYGKIKRISKSYVLIQPINMDYSGTIKKSNSLKRVDSKHINYLVVDGKRTINQIGIREDFQPKFNLVSTTTLDEKIDTIQSQIGSQWYGTIGMVEKKHVLLKELQMDGFGNVYKANKLTRIDNKHIEYYTHNGQTNSIKEGLNKDYETNMLKNTVKGVSIGIAIVYGLVSLLVLGILIANGYYKD